MRESRTMAYQRVQKIIADAGIASRRRAETFVREGRVRVNGEVVSELGQKADPDVDTIDVEGYGVLRPESKVVIALHKPAHVISSARDPEGRLTVVDLVERSRAVGPKRFEGELPRLYPVGRLDFDAEGLILLTNDGGLANALTHPRYNVPRSYLVKVKGRPKNKDLDRLRRGVALPRDDGGWTPRTKPADVVVARFSTANTWLELTLFEGRYHQVKRMARVIGCPVIRLIRTSFAGLELGALEPGQWRFLMPSEVQNLSAWRQQGQKVAPRAPKSAKAPSASGSKATSKRSSNPAARPNAAKSQSIAQRSKPSPPQGQGSKSDQPKRPSRSAKQRKGGKADHRSGSRAGSKRGQRR